MFYVQLMGGLGNQMFQYAAAYSLSSERLIPFKTFYEDDYPFAFRMPLLHVFSLELNWVDEEERQQINIARAQFADSTLINKSKSPCRLFKEKSDFIYDERLATLEDDSIIEGYWQNELYFKKNETEIRQLYRLKSALSLRSQKIWQKIKRTPCPVSIHIRRGDYAYVPSITAIHGFCPMDYYFEAMKIIKKKFPLAHFFIFSDDINWVEQYFTEPFCDIITPDFTAPYEDLTLMSKCSHHIIANSSFSWWGAWLNSSKEKVVISPKEWMKDQFDLPIINPGWILI